jgi:hypothetical protein
MNTPEVVTYRKAKQGDLAFVLSSFLASFRDAHAAGPLHQEDWQPVMSRTFQRWLRRPGAELWVAAHPTENDGQSDLYAWALVELPPSGGTPYLLYCYSKLAYRKLGLIRNILKAALFDTGAPWEYATKTAVITSLDKAGKLTNGKWAPLRCRFDVKEKP